MIARIFGGGGKSHHPRVVSGMSLRREWEKTVNAGHAGLGDKPALVREKFCNAAIPGLPYVANLWSLAKESCEVMG